MTQHLGKYEILGEIGRGGFATVYRARDPDLDREVALKVLDPALMRDPLLVERFRREARAAARLRHPGIVTIHEIGQAEGLLFIATELLPGPSLAEIIQGEAPLPVKRAVELLRPLAEALDYAHGQGLIHRDVKPSNAILSPAGRPVLTDFGLVKVAEESGSSAVSLTLSQTGTTLGTPAYMAPEQADPKAAAVDQRADLYSLGVIAYELLTGRVPFTGNTPLAVAMGHLLEPPPPPRDLNPALPEATEAALLRALEKKPEARFPSAAALVAALGPEVEGCPKLPEPGVRPRERQVALAATDKAPVPPMVHSAGSAFPAMPPPELPAAETHSTAQHAPAAPGAARVPGWGWLLALLAMVALAVGLGLVLGGGRFTPPPTTTATPTPTVPPTGTLQVLQDAGFTVYAWKDDDADGRQSQGETPLSGVVVELVNPDSGRSSLTLTTNSQGRASIFLAGWGCNDAQLRLVVPTGYESTTPILVEKPGCQGAEFGLRPESSLASFPEVTPSITPTSTLIPASPTPGLEPGDTWVRPIDGMVMVYVPTGEFAMGSADADPEADDREKPQHTVYLDAFWVDRTEVTSAQYRKCVDAGSCKPPVCTYGYHRSNYGDDLRANYPVNCIAWSDAQAYCQWAGARLPTEAEWEKAARGTDERKYPWGDNAPDCTRANYYGKDGGCVNDTVEVGRYPKGASPYGALDMVGNVREWVADWYDESYYGQSPARNPMGPDSGDYRILRGGGYDNSEIFVADRSRNGPGVTYETSGFRCSVSAQPSP